MDRRSFLRTGAVTAGAVGFSGALWGQAFAAPAQPGPSPWGSLQAADANGIRLPVGFRSRVVARSGQAVGSTGYVWHGAPDGAAVFPTSTGGWIYVSNSELPDGAGGASALRFSRTGGIDKAYRVLSGTRLNCSGGATPWERWLSGEEIEGGLIYECDPRGSAQAVARAAMGRFKHEAAAVDPVRGAIYLTEDQPDGCFYRFRPSSWPSLAAGTLEVACPGSTAGSVVWKAVPDPAGTTTRTRFQVPGVLRFNGGEGCFYDRDVCFFTTKGDGRVWGYNAATAKLAVHYDDSAVTTGTPVLRGVDGLTVNRARDVFVGEDGDDMQINVIRGSVVFTLLQVTGQSTSEIAGIAFNPAGDRMYFSSQRGTGSAGITYEITGPF